MLLYIILIAILVFLIVLSIIYFDNIKSYLKNKFKKKKKEEKASTPKPEMKVEDFMPLKSVPDDQTRDLSLQELFAENNLDSSDKNINQETETKNEIKEQKPINDFDSFFNYKKNVTKNKSISQKIKDLPPEIKALLIDDTLKKRDDV